MSKRLYIVTFLILSLVFQSCDQDIKDSFSGKNRVHFKHYTLDNNKNMIFFDSQTISFGLLNDTIATDTARVVIELLGRISAQDQHYKIAIVADSTNAQEDVHYKSITTEGIIRAGKMSDTLKIVIIREHLSKSFRNPQDITLCLQIVATEDLDLGMAKGVMTKLKLNNYLTEPTWWQKSFMGELKYYHPEKWKIMIKGDPDFATYGDVPYGINSGKGRALLKYLMTTLSSTPTFDNETGERVTFNALEPVN